MLSHFQECEVREMLKLACGLDNEKLIESITNEYPNVDPDFKHVFACCLIRSVSSTNVIQYCLHKKVDPSYNQNILIIAAASKGNLKLVEILVKDERVDISDQGNEALVSALAKKHFEVVKVLLKNLKNPISRDLNLRLRGVPEDILKMIEERFENDEEQESELKKIKI
jgi:hypothetical protein